jgi:hypothetical protein
MIDIVRTYIILKYYHNYYAYTTGLQKNIYENTVTCQISLKHGSQKTTYTYSSPPPFNKKPSYNMPLILIHKNMNLLFVTKIVKLITNTSNISY